eukprot:Amastigsp_a393_6.p3 type:complete len:109 gc:universal Amastigsp_a393_6:637-311(-)
MGPAGAHLHWMQQGFDAPESHCSSPLTMKSPQKPVTTGGDGGALTGAGEGDGVTGGTLQVVPMRARPGAHSMTAWPPTFLQTSLSERTTPTHGSTAAQPVPVRRPSPT